MSPDDTLGSAKSEFDRNLYHLGRYANRLRALKLERHDAFAEPDDAAIEAIDLFVLRFLKSVDASTRRLFPAILRDQEEYDEGMALIDVLNRMEKLGWIAEAERWRTARERRNQLTHEYPDAPRIRVAILEAALELERSIQSDSRKILKRLSA